MSLITRGVASRTMLYSMQRGQQQQQQLFQKTIARRMGGGGSGNANGPEIPVFHTRAGEALQIMMWVWVFHRARMDGAVLLGFKHPWEH